MFFEKCGIHKLAGILFPKISIFYCTSLTQYNVQSDSNLKRKSKYLEDILPLF